ncbi:MAG TPA: hypothetical protein VJL39_00680 [Candidatus Paceibacterota bacterium]
MNTRVLTVGIAIIILGSIAYYVATNRTETVMGGVDSQMPAEGSNADEMVVERDPLMSGKWGSKEDAKFVREFRADGTFTDTYEGDASATMSGTWAVVDPTKENVGIPAASLSGITVVRMNFADGPMYFGVNALSETDLTLTNYSGRGNILMFSKIQ